MRPANGLCSFCRLTPPSLQDALPDALWNTRQDEPIKETSNTAAATKAITLSTDPTATTITPERAAEANADADVELDSQANPSLDLNALNTDHRRRDDDSHVRHIFTTNLPVPLSNPPESSSLSRGTSNALYRRQGHNQRSQPAGIIRSQPLPASTVSKTPQPEMYSSTSPSLGASYSDGDTQPLGSHVYRDLKLRPITSSQTSHKTTSPNGHDSPSREALPETYDSGATGYINIIGSFPSQAVDRPEYLDDSGDDVDELSQDEGRQLSHSTYAMPKTPGSTGRKRNHLGEVINAAETPDMPVNPFGLKGAIPGAMALSQAFKGTQAPTSPLVAPNSDPTPERPSPGMYAFDSPGLDSSLLKTPRSAATRAVTEPRTVYVPMKESQAERERERQARFASSPADGPGDTSSDDGFGLGESQRVRRRLHQAKIDNDSKKIFSKITAPRRVAGKVAGKIVTPTISNPHRKERGRRMVEVRASSDVDMISGEETSDEASEPEQDQAKIIAEDREDQANAATDHEIEVPMTKSRSAISKIIATDSPESPSYNRQNSVRTSRLGGSNITHWEPASHHINASSYGSTEGNEDVIDGTQTMAIADSQPSVPLLKLSGSSASIPRTSNIPSSVDFKTIESQIHQNPRDSIAGLAGDSTMAATSSHPSHRAPLSQSEQASQMSTEHHIPSDFNGKSHGKSLSEDTEEKLADSPSQSKENGQNDTTEQSSLPAMEASHLAYTSATQHNMNPNEVQGQDQSTSGNEPQSILVPDNLRAPNTGPRLTTTSHALSQSMACRQEAISNLETSPQINEEDPSVTAIPSRISDSEHPSSSAQTENKNSASRSLDQGRSAGQSNDTKAFETAQTHLGSSSTRAQTQVPVSSSGAPVSQVNSQPPQVRRFTEIAEDPSPPDEIGEVDTDLGVVTSQDIAFHAAVEGSSPIAPSRKRRRIFRSQAPNKTIEETDELQDGHRSSSESVKTPGRAASESVKSAQQQFSEKSPQFPAVEESERIETTGRSKQKSYSKKSTKSSSGRKAPPVQKAQPPSTKISGKKIGRPKSILTQRTFAPMGPIDLVAPEVGTQGSSSDGQGPLVDLNRESFNGKSLTSKRVLALFNGGNAAYYPATCVSVSGTGNTRCKVRFDDGTFDVLDAQFVRRFELREGDVVKVDQDHMRTKNYVVCGFKDKANIGATLLQENTSVATQTGSYPLTDVFGFSTISLAPKLRDCNAGVIASSGGETVDVAMASIYVTKMMWNNFKDRPYTHVADPSLPTTRDQTPAGPAGTPDTPMSRTRRVTNASLNARYAESSAPPSPCSGLFNGMAFAVSYMDNDTEKKRVINSIISNGGLILHDGFEELFQLSELDLEPFSPSKNTPCSTATTSEQDEPTSTPPTLRLTPSAQSLGFTALIADKHSRRAKYMQALALNLPCLSGRWITDSLSRDLLLDWTTYLLPSGESNFLGGTVRSRVLSRYPAAEEARISEMVEERPRLLGGRSVLLVMGRGKVEERRRAYLFLTCALGARRVGRVVNVDGAKRAVIQAKETGGDGWDWIYVDEKEEGGGRADGDANRGRKRKRGRESKEDSEDALLSGNSGLEDQYGVRVVGDEFVIQSLILGRLLED
ncbi:MAG: hypothetical protein M1819_006065 [Sarea resinae]|nr:MAG: hypothetical protein M1819_006065 [Sarea resinae]